MAKPKITPPTQTSATSSDTSIPTVGYGSVEKGNVVDISDYLKPSEPSLDVSSELKGYIKRSEPEPAVNETIKASPETTPVVTQPQGIVQIPDISKRQQAEVALKTNGDTNTGIVWEATETIREDDRIARLETQLRELKKAA